MESRVIVNAITMEMIELHPRMNAKMTYLLQQGQVEHLSIPPEHSCRATGETYEASPSPSAMLGFTVIKNTIHEELPDGKSGVRGALASPRT